MVVLFCVFVFEVGSMSFKLCSVVFLKCFFMFDVVAEKFFGYFRVVQVVLCCFAFFCFVVVRSRLCLFWVVETCDKLF